MRPVTMTALAAFFAMIPMALALERGSEANAPLGRVILGGLLAGEPATLFVLPMLYSLWSAISRRRPRHGREPADPHRMPARLESDSRPKLIELTQTHGSTGT